MNRAPVDVTGFDYLELATNLLRRQRAADPEGGIWEAADLHWWWRRPRASDAVAQRFWMDEAGPVAGVIFTEWGENWTCDPIAVEADNDQLRVEVWEAAHQRLVAMGLDRVEVSVDAGDELLRTRLLEAGFERTDEVTTTTWMDASDIPAVPSLPRGYRLIDRTMTGGVHHLVKRNGPEVEDRLRQTSMYDPQLDLAVQSADGEAVAYGVFWFDPVTLVGLVEPMRTEEGHQRKGLARAVLTSGLHKLVAQGARRLKVSHVTDAAGALYRGAGFQPRVETHTYARHV